MVRVILDRQARWQERFVRDKLLSMAGQEEQEHRLVVINLQAMAESTAFMAWKNV